MVFRIIFFDHPGYAEPARTKRLHRNYKNYNYSDMMRECYSGKQ
jgi:hypothetical protein